MNPVQDLEFLVVDDDEPFCNRLVRALADRGFSAQGALSAESALALFEANPASNVIIDLKLGQDSGLTLVRKLGERVPRPAMVMLTGYGTIATATTAMKLGAIHYLTKPVGVDQILSAFASTPSALNSSSVPMPSLAQVEWNHINQVLDSCDGNVTLAAKALGLHRRSLQRKLQKAPTRQR